MKSILKIRLFRAADMDRLEQIERACFAEDAYDRNLFAEYALRCGGLFLAADRGRGMCGYSITCKRGKGNSAELVSIAVDPAARGRGTATALLESTLRRLRRRKVARLSLMVRVDNSAAISFYAKNGFVRVRVVRKYYERGEDGILMERQV